jgi:glycine hydroxymethyltransferase
MKNAKALAGKLAGLGYNLISGGTDNHLMLVDLRNKGVAGKDAEKALEVSGITVNKNMVPFDDKSPMITSGIRIGTPAVTTRGMKESEMQIIGDLIDKVIRNFGKETVYGDVRNEVKDFCKRFPLYPEFQMSLDA